MLPVSAARRVRMDIQIFRDEVFARSTSPRTTSASVSSALFFSYPTVTVRSSDPAFASNKASLTKRGFGPCRLKPF